MYNNYTKRKGPLFTDRIEVEVNGRHRTGIIEGDLNSAVVRLDGDGTEINGKAELVPSQEVGRATRTWIFNSADGVIHDVIFGEEGLTAAGDKARRK